MTIDTSLYRGNSNLKPKGVQINWTDEMKLEYVKCANDPIYFAEKYVKVVHPDRGLETIKLYDYQKDIINAYLGNRYTAVNTSRQAGKALSLDTPIPTPNGWTTMEDIKVGDTIFSGKGEPTKVTFATDVMLDHSVYEIVFDNGERVKADAEHLWAFSSNVYKSGVAVIETTEKMLEILNKAKLHGQSVKIKSHDGVDYQEKNLLIHPYVFGLWLGDGNSHDGRITCHVDDYPHYKKILTDLGYSVSNFRPDKRRETTGNFNIYGIYKHLKQMGVLRNKHIPLEYEFSSKEQRSQLVQGLMDSDGTCDSKGRCEFYQKNYDIIKSIKRILSSLGVKVRERTKIISGQEYYTCSFKNKKVKIFNLPRKLSLIENSEHDFDINYNYYVKEIVECESVPVRCIQVDNDDHLFLCSESYIPTHNTTTATIIILHYALFNEYKTVALTANKGDSAREILARIQISFESLPKWLQQGVIEWNKGRVLLENGCKVFAGSTSSSSIRGNTVQLLYIDETAFVERWDEFFSSVFPTITAGTETKILLTSTPNGLNHFYKTCEGGRKGTNGYKYIEVPWYKVPGRDEKWKKETLEGLNHDLQKFAQEFECVTGDTEVMVRDTTTGEIKKITVLELYNELEFNP